MRKVTKLNLSSSINGYSDTNLAEANNEFNPEVFQNELPVEMEVKNKDITNNEFDEFPEIDNSSLEKELIKAKEKKEYSKKITTASVTLAWCFIAFCCYEMHRLNDLSPIAFIGTGIVVMIAICVRAYMKRAYQNDLVWMRVNQSREFSKLKQEFGEDFVLAEQQLDVNIDGNS